MAKTWRILSIDGGGIRGLVPATVLSMIEKRTGKRISQLFDIIAGTSTGGLIALGLTKPDREGQPEHTAQDIRDLYLRDAKQIFANPASWFENLLRPKYASSSGIERVMRRSFGDARLKDAVTDILIPCYDIEHRTPHIFKSRWARRQPQYDLKMSEVARAASATPTMFEPLRLARPGVGGHVSLVDGGVFANNPALLAFAEIKAMRAREGDNFLVVSLGTGESMEKMQRKYLTDWGYVRWSIPMIELVSESNSEAIHEQMRYMLPTLEAQRYYRFQVDLPDDVYYPLDDPSKDNMAGLMKAAESLFDDPQTEQELDTLCKTLERLSEQKFNFDCVGRVELSRALEESFEPLSMEPGSALMDKFASISKRIDLTPISNSTHAMQPQGSASQMSPAVQQALPIAGIVLGERDALELIPAVANAPLPLPDESHYQFLPPKITSSSVHEVVLCHALDDLHDVVQPLAIALQNRGVAAIFEKFGLPPQASIRRLVSQAAEATLLNIVVLSPAMLQNKWAAKQLEWIYSRTLTGKNVILPVVHGFDRKDIPNLVHHLYRHWQKDPGKYLEYLFDLAEGTTSAGIDQLADRVAKDVCLWYS